MEKSEQNYPKRRVWNIPPLAILEPADHQDLFHHSTTPLGFLVHIILKIFILLFDLILKIYVKCLGDNVDCWMEIQHGKGPWASAVSGIVPLGTTLTMVVGINDKQGKNIFLGFKKA